MTLPPQEGFFCAHAALTGPPTPQHPGSPAHHSPVDIHRPNPSPRAAEIKYSHLGISYRMQEGPIFAKKSVPRGTLLWNGYTQILV